MTRRLLAWSLVALTVACAEGATDEGADADPPARGLCDAIDLVAGGDLAAAEAAFQDRVHQYLHDLADRLSPFDRQRAAALLRAKQRVEAAVDGGTAGEMHASMVALYRELVTAADAAGSAVPACPGAKAA